MWGPDAIGPDDVRVRGLLQAAFPWFDICLVLFGLGGFDSGIPALRDVFSDVYARAWCATIAVVALGCLLGVAFPERFWRIELYGKAFLAMMLTVYAFALLWAGAVSGDGGRAAVGFMPIAFIGPLIWRVNDVVKDARRNGWKGHV
ncbi:hypothetical protein [Curtobacterium sp. MCBD17_028]|uniref:hypothetical protein n=1 Tax=Curtobacterium sp. MCBD17_028 TaxID=2175670 RepID=UPI0011B67A57|nr:hypothetical protein [Curtobacterium sp. MCBD17_028]